jgi:hypothetical protein
MKMDWVASGGGPIIAIPERVLDHWAGATEDDDDAGELTDYDRASAVEGYVAFLDVGTAKALVFGDDPAPTTFLADRGLFVRRLAADSDAAVLAGLDESQEAAKWQEIGSWEIQDSLLLFDSAFAGSDTSICGHLRVDLAPGIYSVSSAYVEPNPDTWLVLVRLTPNA